MVRVIESAPRPERPGERQRLENNIGNSRRVQGRLRKIGLAGIALVIGLVISPLDGAVALIGAATVGIVVGVGYWITSGHIREWNERLREIDRAAAMPAGSGRAPQS
jgi:hypothetical protein